MKKNTIVEQEGGESWYTGYLCLSCYKICSGGNFCDQCGIKISEIIPHKYKEFSQYSPKNPRLQIFEYSFSESLDQKRLSWVKSHSVKYPCYGVTDPKSIVGQRKKMEGDYNQNVTGPLSWAIRIDKKPLLKTNFGKLYKKVEND